MTVALPPLPSQRLLSAAFEETAAREQVAVEAVEKDFYLTRLIWAIAQEFGDGLLLKGGTLLSKVDLGYRRMSEDVDLVIPVAADLRLGYAPSNGQRLDGIGKRIRAFGEVAGPRLVNIVGDRAARNGSVQWDALYSSAYGAQGILLEASFRHIQRPGRRATLNQLLDGPEATDYADAFCFALDADEARAEKVRAAFTRREIRDYYDLAALLDTGADFVSAEFVALVNTKLAEYPARSLAQQPAGFGIVPRQLAVLEADVDRNLAAMVRRNERRFDLRETITRFDSLWGKA